MGARRHNCVTVSARNLCLVLLDYTRKAHSDLQRGHIAVQRRCCLPVSQSRYATLAKCAGGVTLQRAITADGFAQVCHLTSRLSANDIRWGHLPLRTGTPIIVAASVEVAVISLGRA